MSRAGWWIFQTDPLAQKLLDKRRYCFRAGVDIAGRMAQFQDMAFDRDQIE